MDMSCIVVGCQNIYHSRGLCNRHYRILKMAVQRGQLTWEEAEIRKLCLEKKKPIVPRLVPTWKTRVVIPEPFS